MLKKSKKDKKGKDADGKEVFDRSAAENDPFADRAVNDVPPPKHLPLATDELFKKGKPRVDVLQEHLLGEGKLHIADVIKIVRDATKILKKEPNMLEISAPISIVGDVHGQYYDMMSLFKVGGDPADTTYLFLGDYVDRGSFSVEIVLHLFALKIQYPKTFFMLRGNHECRHLTDYFTFKEECLYKYNLEVYDAIMESFDALPLAALVNDQFLCVHGGIGPEIDTLDDIQEINRFREPPSSGTMCDLLWADPCEEFSADSDDYFLYNEVRGCSYLYGFKAVCDFLERNALLSLIRAHEAQDAGYRMHLTNDATGFPSVITIFSAPNYLDAYGNKGAVLRYDNNVMNIRQFNHTKHPYHLPNFMDVFTWSVPFVAEKVAELILIILDLPDPPAAGDAQSAEDKAAAERRREAVRNKIRAVTKMRLMMKMLREERETVMAIKELAPGGKLPRGLISEGRDALKTALGDFKKAKAADAVNEVRPDVSQDEMKEHAAEVLLQSPRGKHRDKEETDPVKREKKLRRTRKVSKDLVNINVEGVLAEKIEKA